MWEAGGEPLLPGLADADAGWIQRLYLGRGQIRDATRVVEVAEIAGAQVIQGYCPLGQQGADNAGIVEVEEEEKLVLEDRSADICAELILEQVIAGKDRTRIVAEPAIGFQGRIAMIFI